jgi:putative acetyltransferase
LDHRIVVVIGHPAFYPKFGFKPARDFGLECPQYIKGIVQYPESFGGV